MMDIKIGTKLITSFILVVLLMTALSLYSVSVSQDSLQESVGENSMLLADEMMKRINNNIYFKVEDIRVFAATGINLRKTILESNKEFENISSINNITNSKNIDEYINQKEREWTTAPDDEITPFMQEIIGNELSEDLRKRFVDFYAKRYGYAVFEEVFVTNKYGVNIAQTQKTTKYRQDDEEWWQTAKENGFYVNEIKYDKNSGTYMLIIGARVDDDTGNFIGVIRAVLGVNGIVKKAELTTKRYETTEIKLITNDGQLIYSTRAFKFMENISGTEFFKEIHGDSGFFISEEAKKEKLFSYRRSNGYMELDEPDWTLLVTHDVNEVLRPSLKLKNNLLLASLVLIIISILIAVYISYSISKPIGELTGVMDEISKGNLDVEIDPKLKEARGEVGELARAFDRMVISLKMAMRLAKQKNRNEK